MDLLSNRQARRAILDYYQASGEPQAVQEAIKVSERQAMNTFTLERMKHENTGYVHALSFPVQTSVKSNVYLTIIHRSGGE